MPVILDTFHRSLRRKGPNGGAEAQVLRERADAARDQRDWKAAATAYQAYLALAPRDFGIWVQLGHSHKEARDLTGAASAYRRALRLKPRDADALLSYGHLLKLSGNLAGAVEYYCRSLAIDQNSHAWRELRAPALEAHLGAKGRIALREAERRAFGRLQSLFAGLRLTAVNDVSVTESGEIAFLSEDPWVVFELADAGRPHLVGELQLLLEPAEGDPAALVEAPMQRLYIDHGKGFSERNTLTFRRDGREDRSVLLVGLDGRSKIRWDPNDRVGRYRVLGASYREVTDRDELLAIAEREAGSDPIYHDVAVESVAQLLGEGIDSFESKLSATHRLMPSVFDIGFDYLYWLKRYYTLTPQDYRRIAEMTEALARRPTFSFVVPAYNTPVELLRECLDSLLAQTYPDFEVCVVDDCSPDEEVYETLQEYAEADERVRIARRPVNGHISAASNTGLALAGNEFVVLVDHDDKIPDYALFVVAYYLNLHPDAKILFSDEDKMSAEGERFDPYFKGIFNKYLMYGHNMVSHLGVYDRSLLCEIGGFRLGLEGSQDYDLFLRAYERIDDHQIVHIPHVLYHWRAIAGSTAVSADQKGYAVGAARDAINGHFERTRTPLRSTFGFAAGLTAVAPSRHYRSVVSIIIPTHDGLDVLRPCIESIYETSPSDFEIIVVDNRSSDPDTLAYLDKLCALPEVTVVVDPSPFNFSEINNRAAAVARGDILCFLNNDTEVLGPKWLDRARGWLALDEIGMVGARLLFEDRTLQHFGIGLGMADHKVAAIPHSGLPADASGYFGKARLLAEVSAVTAACMFIRKADFDALGGFEPELVVAFNDVDLSIRIREKGLRIICDPDILLIHKESRTRGSDAGGEKRARLDREAQWMRRRWSEVLDNDPYLSPNQSLDRADYGLAYPPRVPLPWARPAV